MSMSDEERARILEEERVRAEARAQAEREQKNKGFTFKKLIGGCLFVFIGIPVGLSIIGGFLAGISGNAGETGKAGQTQHAKAPQTEGNIVDVKLGNRTVKAALVDETLHLVEKVERRKRLGNEFVSETADGEFLIVRLVVRNDSKESRTIGASQMSVIDTAGREFHTSSEGSTALMMSGDKSAEFLATQVQPGLEKRITIVFDVPPGSKNLKLKVPSGAFGDPAVMPL